MAAEEEEKKASFWDAFRDPRLALMIPFGFASGLPNPIIGDTLSAWLHTSGVGLTAIGLFSSVHLPYNFKFVWAPLMDRFGLPFLSRRRDWMLVSQLALLVGIGLMGQLDPSVGLYSVVGLAWLVAFAGASQDITVDAYRTELLGRDQRASGVAIFVAAYRVALLISGAAALALADHIGWRTVFWGLSGLMLVGIIATWLSPPLRGQPPPPRTLGEAIIEPFREFLTRDNAFRLLWIVALYKFGDVVVGRLRSPFLLELGFTLTEIGVVGKFVGIASTIVGALVGGGFVAKLGLRRALIVFGIGQALPNLTYAFLALTGKSLPLMGLAYGLDNFMGGMGTAALLAFFMTLCNKHYTATQYALLTSLMSVPGILFGMGSGWFAEHLGWPAIWVFSVAAALPAIFLLMNTEIVEPVDLDDEPAPKEF